MAKDQAINFLRDLLAGGPLPTNEVRARAEAAGFAWAMMRRVKNKLGVEAVRRSEGNVGDGEWLWSFPGSQGTPAVSQDAPPQGAQAAQAVPTQAAQPSRQRMITVRRPGVAPQGPDEISWEVWESLGREQGTNCPRVKEFLRQRTLGGQ
jgi:hypothetical protein